MKKDTKYPVELDSSSSILAKHLTRDIFDLLIDKKTSSGFGLMDAINSGVKNPDSSIGVYAGDEESYEVFAPLFDPIIEEYHGFDKSSMHKSNLNPDDLRASNPDKDSNYIVSTRIRVGRNIANIPLGTAISTAQRRAIQIDIEKVLNSFDGELEGSYYSLADMSSEDRDSLIEDHFLFKAGDRFLEAAGLNRDWPQSRGIFHNHNKTFLVWVNEEDELRIISMQMGGDIKEVFTRLAVAIKKIEEKMEFAYSDHLGYITSCPTNLGTAMRASVHIKVPLLSQNMIEFEKIASKHNVQIRGIHGEHSQSEGGVYDISNKRRLGVTEVECVQDMYDGVVALISREKELESK